MSSDRLDLVNFGAQEIRLCLKLRALFIEAGLSAESETIRLLNEIRDHYLRRVGMAAYLSQMLGPLAVIEAGQVALCNERGEPLARKLSAEQCSLQIQRYLAGFERLPYQVSFQGLTRYL